MGSRGSESTSRPSLLILNQSLSPTFQRMLEETVGQSPAILYTGTPFPSQSESFQVKSGPVYDRRSLARRALSWSSFAGWALLHGIRIDSRKTRPFLLAVTNPPFLPHITATLASLKRLRYGLILWDLYPQHLVHAGICRPQSLVVRGWNGLNRRVLSRAEFVVTLGPAMQREVVASLAPTGRRPRFEVIPNFSDTDWLLPIPKSENPFAAQMGQLNRLTFLYSGNLGASHELTGLLEAAKALEKDKDIGFLIVGDGLGRSVIEDTVQNRGLHNVTLAPRQPWSVLPQLLATGEVAIVSQSPGTSHLSVPSKTYSAMAAGSAILALTEPNSDLAHTVESHRVGLVRHPQDRKGIISAIRELASDRVALADMRRAARETALKHYSLHAAKQAYYNLLSPYLSLDV